MTTRLTAVLLTSSETASSRLVRDPSGESRPHPKGSLLLVPPGEVVFFSFRARKLRSFVFRTLGAPEPHSTAIPGVSPGVRLLLHTQTAGRLQRLEELLQYLDRIALPPSSLSDRFYSRLHAVLSGRLPQGKVLRSLLADERPPEAGT